MRKFRELFLLSVSLCLFAFSCTLETAEDGTGSVSITLPGNQVNSRAVSQEETPTKYYIALFYGENATVEQKEGKVRDTHGETGQRIEFTKLRPGPYTLYVRGDAPMCYYEVSKNIKVKPGSNPEVIVLDEKSKRAKTEVQIDLRKLDNITTFNLLITNINGETVYEGKEVDISTVPNKMLTIPFGLMSGKYTVSFTSTLANEERYYIEEGPFFEVYPQPQKNITKTITARPIKTFYVDASVANNDGDGSRTLPVKTLSYAIDKAVGSCDTVHEDISIFVLGKVTEPNPILINNGVNLTLIGEKVGSMTGVIEGSFIIDNANVSVEELYICNAPSQNELNAKKHSFILNNASNLTLKNNTKVDSGFFLSGNSTITIGSNINIENILGTLELEQYEENKKIINLLAPNTVITDYPLRDIRYEVNAQGLLLKKKEYATVQLNFAPNDPKKVIQLKYYNESNPPEYFMEDLTSNNQELIHPLDIGQVYVFELNERGVSGEAITISPIGLNKIAISPNKEDNLVQLNYAKENYNYYVDSLNGNDRLNTGISDTSPFETIQRAIDEIEYKSKTYNAQPYTLELNGDFVGKQSISVTEVKDLVITNKPNCNAEIKQKLLFVRSNVTFVDVNVDKVELLSSSLSFDTKERSGKCSTRVKDIVFNNDKCLINVLKPLASGSGVMNIHMDPSLYKDGLKVIDSSSLTEQPDLAILEFELTNNEWRLDDTGVIRSNKNLTVNLDITPEDSSRYTLIVTEGERGKVGEFPLTSNSNVINEYFIPDVIYTLKVIDNYDYNKVIATQKIVIQNSEPFVVDFILSRTVYVSYNGSDSNSGLTKDSGFKTLTKAYEVISAKANKDNQSTYNILIVPDPTIDNSQREPMPTPLTNLGSITVDSPIKLNISGIPPRSDYDVETTIPMIIVEPDTTLVKITNNKAEVSLDYIFTKVPGDEVLGLTTVPPLFEVKEGNLVIGEFMRFEYMPTFNDIKLLKVFFDLGSGVSKSSVTLSKCECYADNDDNDMLVFVKVHPNGIIKVPPTYCDEVKTKKSIYIEETLISDFTRPLVQRTDGTPLTIEMAAAFNLQNIVTMTQNTNKYLNTEGKFVDKQPFVYNITNLPKALGDSTDFINGRGFELQLTQNGYVVTSNEAINGETGNTCTNKLCPGYNYELSILAGRSNPIASKNFIFDPATPLDVPLFNVLVNNPDKVDNYCKITEAISSITSYIAETKIVQDGRPINENVNVVVTLNGENYKEGSNTIGTNGIQLPENVSLTIRKDDNVQKAKILLSDNSFITNTLDLIDTNNITFENISFETNIVDPVSGAPEPIFNLTNGNWKFNNVSVTNRGSTTSPLIFINSTLPANVIFEGNINIDPFIVKLNKSTDSVAGEVVSAISVSGPLTNTKPIKVGVYKGVNEDYTGSPTILKGTKDHNIDMDKARFILTDPNYEINTNGQAVPKQPIP